MAPEDETPASAAESAAVRHLIELGYEDPRETAWRQRKARDERKARLAHAQQQFRAGQFLEAIDALEALVRDSPEWASPRRLLAAACVQTKQLARAVAHLDWLEFHGVEQAQLALLRADIELARRRWDAAIDQADYARHLDRSAPGPEVVIGEVLVRRGDLDGAEAAYRSAAKFAPGDVGALAGLSAVALRRGDDEAAIDFALQVMERDLHLPLAHYRLGVALARQGRAQEARVALEAFARLSPGKAAPYRWLAVVSNTLGDHLAAEGYLEQGRRTIRARHARSSARNP
jgi:predicted Zn-dependent protease